MDRTSETKFTQQAFSSDSTILEQMKNNIPTDLVELIKSSVRSQSSEEMNKIFTDLSERIKQVEKENQDKIPIGDFKTYIEQLSKCYKLSTENNRIFCEEYKCAIDNIKIINKNNETYNQNIERIKKVFYALSNKFNLLPHMVKQPIKPNTFKNIPSFIFLDIPWYWMKRVYFSRHVRDFLVIILCSFYIATLGLLGFIARDNTILKKEYEKNLLIRKHLRKANDKETIKTINGIDMLYADEEAHYEDLQRLWLNVNQN